MAAFFAKWELWEKMTFCLALAIILAIVLGLAKNLHTKWRLRKYSVVESKLLETSPNMVEVQINVRNEASFGIRALESGVEVEGVWISHSNTPVPSCPGSPASSIAASISSSFLDEPITPSFAIIEGPNIRVQDSDSTQSYYAPLQLGSEGESIASWTIDTNGFKQIEVHRSRPRSTPVARQHTSTDSTISSISGSGRMNHAMTRTLTSSSDDRNKPYPASTVPTSPSASSHRSGKVNALQEEPGCSQNRRLESEEEFQIHAGTEGLLHSSADLGLLYSHRLSHVAETGQLVPRCKRSPVSSVEWSKAPPGRETRPRHPPISMNNRGMSKSLLATPTIEIQDPFAFAPSQASRTTNSPMVTTNNSSEHISIPVEAQVRPKLTHEHIGSMSFCHERFYGEHTGAISAISTLSKPKIAHVMSNFEQNINSKVLRKVNDEFEILEPTTTPATGPNGSPPHKIPKDDSRTNSRRLSKERLSDVRDRKSFIEVVYGNESRSKH